MLIKAIRPQERIRRHKRCRRAARMGFNWVLLSFLCGFSPRLLRL